MHPGSQAAFSGFQKLVPFALRRLVFRRNGSNFFLMDNDSFQTRDHFSAVEQFIRHFRIEERETSQEHVSRILRYFAQLPYENLSKILRLNRDFGSPAYRFPEVIIDDYKQYKLGGTCFSLTFFLKTILDYYGYDTHVIMADMNAGDNTHCALVLHDRGRQFLLDPGYLLHRPLELTGDNQADLQPNASVLLLQNPEDGRFSLSTVKNRNRVRRYSFANVPTGFGDFRKHWDRSFHWMTMHGLCLSKRDENGFIYLHNQYLRKEGGDLNYKGKFQEEVAEVVHQYFGVPKELIRSAEQALRDNLHFDKELGFKVPKWVK